MHLSLQRGNVQCNFYKWVLCHYPHYPSSSSITNHIIITTLVQVQVFHWTGWINTGKEWRKVGPHCLTFHDLNYRPRRVPKSFDNRPNPRHAIARTDFIFGHNTQDNHLHWLWVDNESAYVKSVADCRSHGLNPLIICGKVKPKKMKNLEISYISIHLYFITFKYQSNYNLLIYLFCRSHIVMFTFLSVHVHHCHSAVLVVLLVVVS